MKIIYPLLIVLVLLSSCGDAKKNSVESVLDSNNLEKIRGKRTSLVEEQKTIDDKIKLLDQAISRIDTVKNVPLITTFKAKEEVFNHILEIQGNVSTKNLIVITPEYNGILTNVYVKEGEKVKKGQLLAKIDDGGLSQQLAQLKIQSDLAKTTFERQKRLWDQQIGSEIQFLQAKSSYDGQQESMNQLQKQIAKTMVRAPFSGTIDNIITEQGSVVSAGQSQLIRIVNLNDMYIETDVPERYISTIVEGNKVEVAFPVLGKTLETTVEQAANFIDPTNRTFKVKITIPNKEKTVKPNLTARLKINDYTNEKALLVPLSIISENADGEQYLYVVEDKNDAGEGVAKRVIIKTGKTQGDVIEVLSGIKDGEEIIQEGARSVKEGQIVKVLTVETIK
ncbi:efflux RND transporter periplasmic adaptor subunit [Bizionia gelidisalsuginis]|uniref:Efflux RND transporter periplasmic adaptor subunit n=2 Tax=Bizionia TaxID=283785 RepID=A0A8H2LHH6_9FLAO|nr:MULTISPECIES: efflux RND transporter periplasmic adaptor subunit [Bizionia]TYB76087.1 efflux RND transporter periplasmic adaptor subunit [Bizionia saleffrena]TYC11379.1 efflux RND transporter periplasmic adaptor subunit [Bizionia gelidisalsuginis]